VREIRQIQLIDKKSDRIRVMAVDEDGFLWLGVIAPGESDTAAVQWTQVPSPDDALSGGAPMDFWGELERKLRSEAREETT